MELMAQSVSWFYPSFPGRHLYVVKCLRIVLGWVSVFPEIFSFQNGKSCSVYQSSLYAKMCGYYGSKWLLYEY